MPTANKWGCNPIYIDQVTTETDWSAAKDNDEYVAERGFIIQAIKVKGGADTNAVVLLDCPLANIDGGTTILDCALTTPNLEPFFTFPNGLKVQGLYPKTLGGSTKLYIYLK